MVDHSPSLMPCWNRAAAVCQLSSYFAASTNANHDCAAITAASTFANSAAVEDAGVLDAFGAAARSEASGAACDAESADPPGSARAFDELVRVLEHAPDNTS